MGRKRNNGLSEEKRNIIGQLIELYDIQSAADIQEALKDLLGGTIQSMLETELEEQVESREESDSEYHNSRNGYKPKPLRSSMGEIPIQAPRDRNIDFEPQAAPKYQKNISEIEGKIIAALTERRGNAMLFSPTAMGIRSFFASPSAIHFSISPATCQGQAAKAVAAFAVIRRRDLWLQESCAYRSSSAYRKS